MSSPGFPRGREDDQLTQKHQKGLNLPNESIHGIAILRQGKSLFPGDFISCCGPDLALSSRIPHPSLRDQLHSFCQQDMHSNIFFFYQGLLVAKPAWVSVKWFQYLSFLSSDLSSFMLSFVAVCLWESLFPHQLHWRPNLLLKTHGLLNQSIPFSPDILSLRLQPTWRSLLSPTPQLPWNFVS